MCRLMETNEKTSNSKQGFGIHSKVKKISSNIYEPEVALKDKLDLKTYCKHQLGNVEMDEAPTKIKAQELHIAEWTSTEDQQLMKFNIRINAKPQLVKIKLETCKVLELEQLLKEFKVVLHGHTKILKGFH